jgi:hypothetical protein
MTRPFGAADAFAVSNPKWSGKSLTLVSNQLENDRSYSALRLLSFPAWEAQ